MGKVFFYKNTNCHFDEKTPGRVFRDRKTGLNVSPSPQNMNKTEKKPKNIHFPSFDIGGLRENQNIASIKKRISIKLFFLEKKNLTETENPPRISIVTNLTQQLSI